MKNVTRTLNVYEVYAFDMVPGSKPEPDIEVVAQCEAENATMNKALARAELSASLGYSLPRGMTISWRPIGTITYAMSLEKFIDNATVLSRKSLLTDN